VHDGCYVNTIVTLTTVAVGIVIFLATFISCIYFSYNMQIHIAISWQYIVANTGPASTVVPYMACMNLGIVPS
jgi:hypothetical protein